MRRGLPPMVAVVAALLLLTLTGVVVGVERQRATTARDGLLAETVLSETAEVEAYLERARAITLLTAQNPSFAAFYASDEPRAERIARQEATHDVRASLAYLGELYPDAIGEACFIDAAGSENARVVRGVSALPANLSPDETQAIFFAPTMALPVGAVHHSLPYRSPDTGEWVISNSTPLDDADGRRLGIVHYEVTIESFRRGLAESTAGVDQVRLTDADGVVLMDSGIEQRVEAPLGVPDDATLRDSARRAGAGSFTDGGRRHVVRALAQGVGDDNHWYVVASVESPAPLSAAGISPGAIGLMLGAVLLLVYGRWSLRDRQRLLLAVADGRRRDAEERSRTDPLTGLLNRRGCIERLTGELHRAERDGMAPGVFLVDADHFKRVNDAYGHAAGDAVLVEVARRLRDAVRDYDIVARWGGEEFCVVVPAMESDAELVIVGEALRTALADSPIAAGADTLVRVTISVGAVRPGHGRWSVEAIIDAADRALYAAKGRGRNQIRLFAQLTVADLAAEEPEAIRLARVLALPASTREGMSEHHAEQVADLAGATALSLALDDDTVLHCRLGGWLHDVGKVAIPDRILMKPGPLDDAEWTVMRSHAVVGEEIVSRLAGLSEAALAVRHHHEHVDGTGYPDGLAGDAIPIEARIVAAADAYTVLTADRPYRRSISQQAAIDELRASVGTHLDGDVVEALVRALDLRSADVAAKFLPR